MSDQLRSVKIPLLVLTLYLSISVFITLNAPADVWVFLFSENGPYEYFSPWIWLFLSCSILCSSSLRPSLRMATSAAALLMAARELDMHKSFFSMSFIKTNFYKGSSISFHDKIVGGMMLIAITALAIYLLITFIRHLKSNSASGTPAILLIGSLALGGLSKVLDRISAILRHEFQIVLPNNIDHIIVALEESIEMAIPVLMIVAFYSLQQQLNKSQLE